MVMKKKKGPTLEKFPDGERWVWTDEQKEENLEKFMVEFVWVFDNLILEKYEQDNPEAFTTFHYDHDSSLPDDLRRLWRARVKNFREGNNTSEDAWLEWEWVVDEEVWKEIEKERKRLIKHGRKWECFWFEKKYFDNFIEFLENYVEEKPSAEEKLSERVEQIIGWTLTRDEGCERSEEEIKAVVEKIKKSNRDFIADLKEIRRQLKNNLRGWLYYWDRHGQWVGIVFIVFFGLLNFFKKQALDFFQWLFG